MDMQKNNKIIELLVEEDKASELRGFFFLEPCLLNRYNPLPC